MPQLSFGCVIIPGRCFNVVVFLIWMCWNNGRLSEMLISHLSIGCVFIQAWDVLIFFSFHVCNYCWRCCYFFIGNINCYIVALYLTLVFCNKLDFRLLNALSLILDLSCMLHCGLFIQCYITVLDISCHRSNWMLCYPSIKASQTLLYAMLQNGLFTMLPYLSFWMCINIGGTLADFLIEKKILRVVWTRKLMDTIGIF